ncbi:hypothetical protein OG552_33665 [Streptomyces sp. NBC_01476]|uniref:hypothetical protein n=1 Tax=Streptomyces sp. NBC_01476 TaxID=2903881 RepID=UPI002E36E12D|nr:hypothetical protein [Streptomyces sp. NBC_01476]
MDQAAERPRPASGERPWPAPRRIEELLRGAPVVPGDLAEARLAELVATLAAPATLDPVREQRALSAFRLARTVQAARPHRGPAWPLRALAGGVLAVCALGVLTLAVGGVPSPLPTGGVHAGPPTGAAGRGATTAGPGHTGEPVPDGGGRSRGVPTTAPAAGPTAEPTTGPTTGPMTGPTVTASPAPAARGPRALCRQYRHALRQGRQPGRRITDRLRQEAGGQARIAGYCHRLLAPGNGAVRPGGDGPGGDGSDAKGSDAKGPGSQDPGGTSPDAQETADRAGSGPPDGHQHAAGHVKRP